MPHTETRDPRTLLCTVGVDFHFSTLLLCVEKYHRDGRRSWRCGGTPSRRRRRCVPRLLFLCVPSTSFVEHDGVPGTVKALNFSKGIRFVISNVVLWYMFHFAVVHRSRGSLYLPGLHCFKRNDRIQQTKICDQETNQHEWLTQEL